jgi:hypothetical protein
VTLDPPVRYDVSSGSMKSGQPAAASAARIGARSATAISKFTWRPKGGSAGATSQRCGRPFGNSSSMMRDPSRSMQAKPSSGRS